MTEPTTAPEAAPEVDVAGAPRPRPRLRWWVEVLLALGFYGLYSYVRSRFGAGPESRTIAFHHAVDIIDLERSLHLWFEPQLQHWYLSLPGHGWVRGWNIFYGTAHFFVTIGLLIAAFAFAPHRYRFVRTMLAVTTALALLGFATFTLMPPRLLDASGTYGACRGQRPGCNGYGLVDTIDRYGGIWKFGTGKASMISNQYAAMPSLHFGWSSWCAITLVIILGGGSVRRRRLRWLAFLYPSATLFCILVTANHYWLDALFGAIALAIGALVATLVEHRRRPAHENSTTSALADRAII
jgi:hypothetical protein